MKYTRWCQNDSTAHGYAHQQAKEDEVVHQPVVPRRLPRPPRRLRGAAGSPRRPGEVEHQVVPYAADVNLGFGRIVVSEKRLPNMLVNLI